MKRALEYKSIPRTYLSVIRNVYGELNISTRPIHDNEEYSYDVVLNKEQVKDLIKDLQDMIGDTVE